jgi:outer membrane protein assembly factor BamB
LSYVKFLNVNEWAAKLKILIEPMLRGNGSDFMWRQKLNVSTKGLSFQRACGFDVRMRHICSKQSPHLFMLFMNRFFIVKNLALLLCLMVFGNSTIVWAQTPAVNTSKPVVAVAPTKINVKGNINWMKLSPSGKLVIGTAESLYGIDANSKAPLWKFDKVKDLKESQLETIANTPYAIIQVKGQPAITLVIDLMDGRLVFDSKQNGYSSINKIAVYADEQVIFVDGNTQYAVYGLLSGRELFALQHSPANECVGQPIIDDQGNIIIPGAESLLQVAVTTGKIMWEQPALAGFKNMFWGDKQGVLYGTDATGKLLYSLNPISGMLLWSKPAKLKKPYDSHKLVDMGLFISMFDGQASSLNLYNYATGETVWRNEPKLKGQIKQLEFTNKGLLFSETGAANRLHYLSFDGNGLWESPVKIGDAILEFKIMGNNLVYVCGKMASVLSLTTGMPISENEFSFLPAGGVVPVPAFCFDQQRNRCLINTVKGIFALSTADGQTTLFKDSILFQGGEFPTNITQFRNGYSVSSSHNYWLLSIDGKVLYKKYYNPLTGNGLAQSELTTNTLYQLKDEKTTDEALVERWSTAEIPALKAMSERLKLLNYPSNIALIHSRVKTKTGEAIGLLKLDKNSGKLLKNIVWKDESARYLVDEKANVVYLQSGSSVTVYRF